MFVYNGGGDVKLDMSGNFFVRLGDWVLVGIGIGIMVDGEIFFFV